MATMFRVSIPDGGPATVSTSVVAYSTCGASEIAVMVGTSVPRERCGSELREFMRKWAAMPKATDAAVGGTNRKIYVAAPGVEVASLAGTNTAQATAPTETQWGIIVGDVAALYLGRSNVLEAAMQRAADKFTTTLGQ
ncbi:MAG: hypothetical protein IPO00_08840 [Betaproteobacteria bacterium]|nr:hypothetical protein [Betaproteobacteria bacterium]